MSYTLVGLFVVILAVLGVAIPLWLHRGELNPTAREATYVINMPESVAGLTPDEPVRYHGVPVGRVRGLRLNPRNVAEVQVTLGLRRGTPIKTDTYATLRSQPLTGLSTIDLEGGSQAAPPLTAPGHAPPVIPARPSLVSRLETVGTAAAKDLRELTREARATLDEDNRRALAAILRDLARLTDTLARRSGAIDRTIVQSARTMAHLSAVSAQLAHEIPPLLQTLGESATAVRAAAGDIRETSHGVAHFTSTTLPEVGPALVELRQLTGTLLRIATQFERVPDVFVAGPPKSAKGPGE
ncbi:MAG TPA: MlaD family protein [Polyangia bacterium]